MDDLINTEEKLLHSLEMEQLKWLINMVGTALLVLSPFMLPTTPDQHTINIQGWHWDRWCGWRDSWILIDSVWLEVKAVSAAVFYLLKVSEEEKTLFLFAPRGGRVLFFSICTSGFGQLLRGRGHVKQISQPESHTWIYPSRGLLPAASWFCHMQAQVAARGKKKGRRD